MISEGRHAYILPRCTLFYAVFTGSVVAGLTLISVTVGIASSRLAVVIDSGRAAWQYVSSPMYVSRRYRKSPLVCWVNDFSHLEIYNSLNIAFSVYQAQGLKHFIRLHHSRKQFISHCSFDFVCRNLSSYIYMRLGLPHWIFHQYILNYCAIITSVYSARVYRAIINM